MLLALISYQVIVSMTSWYVRGKQEVNLSLFLGWNQKTKVFKNKTMTNAWEIYKNLKSGFTKIVFDLSLFGILSPCEDNGNQNVSVLLWSMLWTMSMVHLEAFERGSKNYMRPFHLSYAKQEVTLNDFCVFNLNTNKKVELKHKRLQVLSFKPLALLSR